MYKQAVILVSGFDGIRGGGAGRAVEMAISAAQKSFQSALADFPGARITSIGATTNVTETGAHYTILAVVEFEDGKAPDSALSGTTSDVDLSDCPF